MSNHERHADEGKKPANSFNMRMVVHAWKRHPVAFLGAILLACSTAAVVWFFLPLPKKSAAMVFHLASQPHVVLTQTIETTNDFNTYKQFQLALLKSRTGTLSKAIKNEEIQNLDVIRHAEPDPVTWLEKKLTVDNRTGYEYLRITIDDDNGDELISILKAVSTAYLEASKQDENQNRVNRLNALEDTRNKIQEELSASQKEIDFIAKLVGPREPGMSLADLLRQDDLREASREVKRCEEEYKSQLSQLESVKSQAYALKCRQKKTARAIVGAAFVAATTGSELEDMSYIPTSLIDDELARDRKMQDLEADVALANRDYKATAAALNPDIKTASPALAKSQESLTRAEEKRTLYAAEARTHLLSIINSNLERVEERRIAETQANCEKVEARKKKAEDNLKMLQEQNERLNGYRLDLEKKRLENSYKEDFKVQISKEIQVLKIEIANFKPRVSVTDPPYIVPGIEGNKRFKYTLIASIALLIAGLVGIVVWEARHQRVLHVDEVSTGLGARLIGTMPPLEAIAHRNEASQEITTGLVEAIDTARTMLLHASPLGAKMRVLTVTSAVSGEGKTTLTGHLAISLTRAGFRTLLVDGDMQAPTAHRLFNLPAAPGLSELLRGEVNVSQAIHSSPIPGLSILPAGNWSMATRQMLVGDRWKSLKQELESSFDFVIIDTSPLLQVTDTILLAREADGVILSVLVGVSQIPCVAQTVSRLKAVGAELVGVVVNNVRNDVYRPKIYRNSSLSITRTAFLSDTNTAIATARTRGDDTSRAEEEIMFAEEFRDSK